MLTRRTGLPAFLAGLIVAATIGGSAGCDLPTAPPEFSFEPALRVPFLFDHTFTLMGDGSDDANVLVDTTSRHFESFFTTDAQNRIYLVQEASGLQLEQLGGTSPVVDLDAEIDNTILLDNLDAFGALNPQGLILRGNELTFKIISNTPTGIVLHGALVGITQSDERLFLSGRNELAADPDTRDFTMAGAPIEPEQLIRFVVQGAPSHESPVTTTIVLNEHNSNLDDFISGLPRELRFAGRMELEPGAGEAEDETPIELELAIGIRIPLGISGEVGLDKTFKADLSGLAEFAADTQSVTITEAVMRLDYESGFPLGLNVRIEALDDEGRVTGSIPASGEAAFALEPAPAAADGLASGLRQGQLDARITRRQLQEMSRGTQLRVQVGLMPNPGMPARLRATDTIRFRLQARARIRVDVGG